MCRLAQIEYRDQIKKAKDEREQLLEERRRQKYEKHYNICQQVILLILYVLLILFAVFTSFYFCFVPSNDSFTLSYVADPV